MFLKVKTLLLGSFLRGTGGDAPCVVCPRRERSAALADAAMEESFCQRRCAEDAAADSTSTLTEDGDVRRVAAEIADVTLYPLQGKNLVEQSVVAGMSGRRLLCQFGMRHEAQGTGAILNADNDDATQSEKSPQVAGIMLCLESAAMNPHHHGQAVTLPRGRRGDAEIETVLAHHVGRQPLTCRLRRPRTELVSLQHALPRFRGLGLAPSQIAHGGCGVGNGFIDSEGSVDNTLYITAFHVCTHKRLCLNADRCPQQATSRQKHSSDTHLLHDCFFE